MKFRVGTPLWTVLGSLLFMQCCACASPGSACQIYALACHVEDCMSCGPRAPLTCKNSRSWAGFMQDRIDLKGDAAVQNLRVSIVNGSMFASRMFPGAALAERRSTTAWTSWWSCPTCAA